MGAAGQRYASRFDVEGKSISVPNIIGLQNTVIVAKDDVKTSIDDNVLAIMEIYDFLLDKRGLIHKPQFILASTKICR